MPTPEQELRDAAAALVKASDETKRIAETAQTEVKNLGTVTSETKASADKLLVEVNTLRQRCDDLEKKSVRHPGTEELEHKSAGQRFVEADEVKAAMTKGGAAFRGRLTLEMKTITSAGSVSGASATTALVPADRQAGIIQVVPNRRLVVRDLLMPGTTSSAAIEYVRETVFTNGAAMVPETTQKPFSDIKFDQVTVPVRTMAHLLKATKQILDDAPMLQSYIDGRMRYGLDYVEDLQLLLGDGTGENILGMVPQATAYVLPDGASVKLSTNIDVLRLAMLQAELALYPATGHVLHPTDWANIELTKDTQGRYLLANPQGSVSPTMWALPVVTSMAFTRGSFLTGAFKYACQVFDREQANVQVSTEDADNFQKNMVTIRAEERLALCVYRPQALIKGTFPAPTA